MSREEECDLLQSMIRDELEILRCDSQGGCLPDNAWDKVHALTAGLQALKEQEVAQQPSAKAEDQAELLRPIAAVLPDYMAPWTRQIPDLAEQWDTFFQGNSAQEFFLQRARIQSGEFRELRLAFRFFSPYGSPGKFLGEKGRLLFHMGVNMQPGLGNAGQAQAPEEWELTALRLMANGSRMEMLHAMAERPMSGQELAQKLNLNSGSVFRDLNSLYNARLLLMESTGGRNCYRTNLPVVRNMMERMLNYLQNQG